MSGHNIIVIGASAGGVEALKHLIGGIPPTIEAAIFIVLHVSPHGPSILPQILSRVTQIPVSHAQHSERFEKGHIYVAPPGHHLLLTRRYIKLSKGPKVNSSRPSIDVLFQSAAHNFGACVIGVVLTGMLDDGSVGLCRIKEHGGITVVQDPDDAIYAAMPQNAINATDVDYVLPLAQIAPQLAELVSSPVQENTTMSDKSNANQNEEAGERIPRGDEVYERGEPSTYICPECGGVLAEFKNGDVLHFECRIGHIYSAESLFASQTETVEAALWTALRALEEGAAYARRMAAQANEKEHHVVETRFEEKADEYERQSEVLRKLLINRP